MIQLIVWCVSSHPCRSSFFTFHEVSAALLIVLLEKNDHMCLTLTVPNVNNDVISNYEYPTDEQIYPDLSMECVVGNMLELLWCCGSVNRTHFG